LGEANECSKRISITFDSRVYSLIAVKKAAYRFLNKFAADIAINGDAIVCLLGFSDSSPEEVRPAIVDDFRKEVLDQDLRERVKSETEAVRNLILAYAFSKTGIGTDG